MPLIRNPILPGFNPDPSILRVDDDYYIATSTFEWLPAHSTFHWPSARRRSLRTSAWSRSTGRVPTPAGVWRTVRPRCG